MLIDVSYFTSGPRHIENASVAEMPSPNSLAVNEVINGYIKAFQSEFLHSAVGFSLSQAITDYLEIIEQEKRILQMRLISRKKMNLNPDMHFYVKS